MSTGAFLCVYHEERRIGPAIAQLLPHMDRILVLLSDEPWHPAPLTDPDRTEWLLRKYYPSVEIVRGTWFDETDQRNDALDRLHGFDRVFLQDPDEYFTTETIKEIFAAPLVFGVALEQRTYWKTPEYRYEPIDGWPALVLIDPKLMKFVEYRSAGVRHVEDIERVSPMLGFGILMLRPPWVVHHFSYVLSDAACARKVATFSHCHDIERDWYETTWKTWSPGSPTVISPYRGGSQVAVYDPAPAEIVTRWEAWQRVCDEEGIAA